MVFTKPQLEQFARGFSAFGGEFLGFDDAEKKVTIKFADADQMMKLVNLLKKDRVGKFIRINSKIIDGDNILTIDPS